MAQGYLVSGTAESSSLARRAAISFESLGNDNSMEQGNCSTQTSSAVLIRRGSP
jgi:hypothetical protein